jgi:hypothetical protein
VVALQGLRRDHVIAAGLAGAVVIVVGYASGLGLKPSSVGAGRSVTADGGQHSTPQTPAGEQPVPSGQLPSPDAVPPMPPVPGGTQPVDVPPSPSDVVPVTAIPAEQPPPETDPTSPGSPTTPPAPTPPGTPSPECRPGLVQPVLDAASGLPLVGDLTGGLGITGPSGLLSTLLGSCPAPAVSTAPPVPAVAGTAVPAAGG